MSDQKLKICVYAIAKNEAKFVSKWYNSMKEADYVVVLDTGSTDDTVQKLKEIGVTRVETKVIRPWRFDVARNESLKLVPEDTDVYVCTDLDEVFEDGWADQIRKSWNPEIHERGEYIYIWRHHPDGTPEVKYSYNKIHNSNWVWRTPVHEYLTRKDDDKNFYYKEENTLALPNVILHHYPDNSKSRSSYFGLLKIRVEEYPDDKISVLYLARECWFYNQFENAIELLKRIITDPLSFRAVHVAFSYMLTGNCYTALAEDESDNDKKQHYITEAERAYSEGINKYPTFMENYTMLGYLYGFYKEYKAAIAIVEMGFKRSKRQFDWTETGINWDVRPLTVLGKAHMLLGNKAIGAVYLAKAAKIDSVNPELKKSLNNALDSISLSELMIK